MMAEMSSARSALKTLALTTPTRSAWACVTQHRSVRFAWMSAITCHQSPASAPHNTSLLWGRRFEYQTFTSRLLRTSSATSAAPSKLEADRGVDRRLSGRSGFHPVDRSCWADAQQLV